MIWRPKTGNRGAALFLLGFLLLALGGGNFVQPPDSPSGKANLAVTTSLIPFTGLVVIWMIVGLYALVAAWLPSWQPWAYAALAGLFLFMGVTTMIAEFTVPGAGRAWYGALLYLGLFAATFVLSGWEEAR